jgi:hypothetical protein
LGGRGRQISEFEASLDYRVSSRTARATHKETLSRKIKKKKKKKKSETWNLNYSGMMAQQIVTMVAS